MNPPYLHDVHAALPRVLGLFDTSPISETCGVGDRYAWAWKGTDFFNGTFQGAAHGLACLVAGGLLPTWLPEEAVLSRISELFEGTCRITHPDGSLDEILPHEKSYCVTALVAFDLLRSIDLLGTRLSPRERARYLEVVAPLVAFVASSEERHGIISNHLAVAAASLARWHQATDADVTHALGNIVGQIMDHRSHEGWFREYEGADPGYQTLLLDYLADLNAIQPGLGLGPALSDAVGFLSFFAHPDGSFGGLYGSRNTRFLYPAGIESMASWCPAATGLANFARCAHQERSSVGLAAIDDSNLIPMFNSFARAAVSAQKLPKFASTEQLPCLRAKNFRKHFSEAGLVVDKNDRTYSVISWKKGGAFQSYADGDLAVDAGPLARDSTGRWYTGQLVHDAADGAWRDERTLVIEVPMARYHVRYPKPLDFVVLRLLSLSAMRIGILNSLIKRLLVKILISKKNFSRSINRRTIRFGERIAVEDEWVQNPAKLQRTPSRGSFHAIHMASQGYWQRSDDI